MNYTIINAYSDYNKGDSAITISTIQQIRQKDENAFINLNSLFTFTDPEFKHHHRFTANLCEKVTCSLFPSPVTNITTKHIRIIIRQILYTIYFLRALILLFFINNNILHKIIMNKDELEAFKSIKKSDIIISKGGSFIYSYKSIRSLSTFIRMVFPIALSIRLNKRTILLGQSIGPFDSSLSKKIAQWILSKSDSVMIREKLCLEHISKLKINDFSYQFIPDLAFALKPQRVDNRHISKPAIGLTVLAEMFFNNEINIRYSEYITKMSRLITLLLSESKDLSIFIFPQVTYPGMSDTSTSELVYNEITNYLKDRVLVIKEDLTPGELKWFYSKMCFFFATRLHSAIFSLSMGVPTINISYHGTKSSGILGDLGLDNYVVNINEVDPQKIFVNYKKFIEIKDQIMPNVLEKINKNQIIISNRFDEIINNK